MRAIKQETREEKICRKISNLSRLMDEDPEFASLIKYKTELASQLAEMLPAKKLTMVPWSETRRETKQFIETLDELIVEYQDKLKAKQAETRKAISDLRKGRQVLEQRLACLKRMGV